MKKKICFLFIYKKWGQHFHKNFKDLPFTKKKKHFLAHCFDSSKTIITDLFLFKRDVLDNNLTTSRGLAENGLLKKST